MNDPTFGIAPDMQVANTDEVPPFGASMISQPSPVDQAQRLTGQATGQVSSLLRQVKDQMATTVSDQKEGIADQIDEIAKAFFIPANSFQASRTGLPEPSSAAQPNWARWQLRCATMT